MYQASGTQVCTSHTLLDWQGALVEYSRESAVALPTAVLVHGIMGSRKNMQSFARMLVQVRDYAGKMQGLRR